MIPEDLSQQKLKIYCGILLLRKNDLVSLKNWWHLKKAGVGEMLQNKGDIRYNTQMQCMEFGLHLNEQL